MIWLTPLYALLGFTTMELLLGGEKHRRKHWWVLRPLEWKSVWFSTGMYALALATHWLCGWDMENASVWFLAAMLGITWHLAKAYERQESQERARKERKPTIDIIPPQQ